MIVTIDYRGEIDQCNEDEGSTIQMKTDADDIEESDVFADEFVITLCGTDQGDSFEKLRRREGVEYLR